MNYPIEKGIPIPTPRARTRKSEFPFAEMDIRDSFLVPVSDADERARRQNMLSSCAKNYAPKKFVTRVVAEGVRVWRVV